ncbi:GNAT family N-acetyltransferase [Plantactinospora sp. KBS50]|uniref:GNAT family N-acetyltransferase n=1 Tax=Plantactinospora sp. KBS50 TaxID=2024580 RepID=UPI000BAAA4E3|nr:GNAT family N-acyltransferase [Plantactinospora sp. KBS50]ASW56554.1 GNAT family N-acetyltransferase [Plantactinospora sp. KBS50]
MAVLLSAGAPTGTGAYTVLIADDPIQVAAGQRLRYQVFADELGARLDTETVGLDLDGLDEYCDHLLVRDDRTGRVVGTYRLLPPDRAAAAGRRYGDSEFDLTALEPLRDQLVEIGRSCVDPEHRTGAVINLMWTGIARYLHLKGLRWLGGCASVPLHDGGATAAGVWTQVAARHLAPPPLRVRPLRPWLAEPGRSGAPEGRPGTPDSAPSTPPPGRVVMPPLLRGYLRLGAWVCGEPGYDPDFDCADFYVLLNLDRMHPRYLSHFLGGTR